MNEQIFRALCAWLGKEGNPPPDEFKWNGHYGHAQFGKQYLNRVHCFCFGAKPGDCFYRTYELDDNAKPTFIPIRDVTHLHELLEQIKPVALNLGEGETT